MLCLTKSARYARDRPGGAAPNGGGGQPPVSRHSSHQDAGKAERSQITGRLAVTMPKVRHVVAPVHHSGGNGGGRAIAKGAAPAPSAKAAGPERLEVGELSDGRRARVNLAGIAQEGAAAARAPKAGAGAAAAPAGTASVVAPPPPLLLGAAPRGPIAPRANDAGFVDDPDVPPLE